jgi:hypothetical protein
MNEDIRTGSTASLAAEGRRICQESAGRGLNLRLFGGVGFYLRAGDRSLFEQLGRDAIRDLDFIGLSEERGAYKQLFGELGYEIDQDLLLAGEGRRFLFRHAGEEPWEVDLFIDRLQMCHTLDLRRRMGLHPETVPLVDLLLQKLQIVELTRKDMADVVVLLADHDFGTEDAEAIDADYAVRLLSDDWGFYYTVTSSLGRVREFVHEAPLRDDVRDRVDDRLERFRHTIEGSSKTRKWKMRAKIGTRKKWYEDVEEDIAAF